MGTATSSDDEWIELYNAGNSAVDMTGWTLTAADGTPNIGLSGAISAGGYYLLERTSEDTVSPESDQIYTGALGNTVEILELRDSTGNVMDRLDSWYAGVNPSGNPEGRATMERIDPLSPGTDASNWATNDGITRNGWDAGGVPINGTPKARNSASQQ